MAATHALRWRFELAKKGDSVKVQDPLGMDKVDSDASVSASGDATKDEQKELAMVQRRVNDIAYMPGKQLFQQGLMLYMSGSGIHIFSIMMTFMAMMSPVKSLLNMGATFKQFQGMDKIDLTVPKLTFLALNLVGMGMGMYKLAVMGLLPLTAADWYQLVDNRPPVEISAATVPLVT